MHSLGCRLVGGRWSVVRLVGGRLVGGFKKISSGGNLKTGSVSVSIYFFI